MSTPIIPHLWFDNQAQEAAELYVALFSDSKIETVTYYSETGYEVHHQPAGQVMTVDFKLAGQSFMMVNGGPEFKFNPSISFTVSCESEAEVESMWNVLVQGGDVLMELAEYPFAKKYGWLSDKYGVNWQLSYSGNDQQIVQKITPSLLFVGDQCGNAHKAMEKYVSLFKNSKIELSVNYTAEDAPESTDSIKYGSFVLNGQHFVAMDSGQNHQFMFNEAVSLMVLCDNQEEVDHLWNALSSVPESEQCGWLKDEFGVSWQIIPKRMGELMTDPDKEKVSRVMEAMLKMKKIEISELEKAFNA